MSEVIPVYRRIIGLAWRNVTRNWRHSLATILAISSGFMAVSLFDGFLAELRYRMDDGYGKRGMLGHLIIQKEGAERHLKEDPWKYAMDAEDQEFLEEFLAKDPDFVRRVRYLHVQGLVSSGQNNAVFMGYGYDVTEGLQIRGDRWAWDTVAGKPLHLAEGPSTVVGGGLGMLLDCHSKFKGNFQLPDGNYVPKERPFECKNNRLILSATTEMAQVNAIDLRVSGLIDAGFREADKRVLRMSLESAKRLLDTDKITMMSVELKRDDAVDGFIKRLETAAAGRGLRLEAVPWLQHRTADYVRGGLELLSVFRNLFMIIVVTICVMAVANTMMKSVNERIREIGTFRSLGFLRRHMVVMFASEGLFISLIACGLGLVLTIVVSRLVAQLDIMYRAGVLSLPIRLEVSDAPLAWIWSAVLLSVLATGTSWFCARKASRMVIADALRHV